MASHSTATFTWFTRIAHLGWLTDHILVFTKDILKLIELLNQASRDQIYWRLQVLTPNRAVFLIMKNLSENQNTVNSNIAFSFFISVSSAQKKRTPGNHYFCQHFSVIRQLCLSWNKDKVSFTGYSDCSETLKWLFIKNNSLYFCWKGQLLL